jgi:hypothetical protein
MRPAGDPGSTDMANVSLYVPTIHPMLGIDTDASNHQPEFAAADGAVGMALTAIDAATDPTLRARLLAHDFVAARDYTAPDLEA